MNPHMKRKVQERSVRNGYHLTIELYRDETPYASGDEPMTFGEWNWGAVLTGGEYVHDSIEHYAFENGQHPAESERELAFREIYAYVDRLKPGPF